MSLIKPAALFVCIALAGCAGKTDSTAAVSKAGGDKLTAAEAGAQTKGEKGGWWPLSAASKEQKAGSAVEGKAVAWMDDYEKRLREAVAGSKFEVERRGDVLVVVAPADASFNKDRPHMLLPVTLGPLSRVAKLVGGDAHSAVLVLGHGDNGADAANTRKLSLERAQAVASIFRMSGLRSDRLALLGLGSDKPRATNDSASGRAQNRRVEVQVTRRDGLSALLAQSGR